jgi:hypothetical protein
VRVVASRLVKADEEERVAKHVASARGWKGVETSMRCCQPPDADTLLAAISEPRKLRNVASEAQPSR